MSTDKDFEQRQSFQVRADNMASAARELADLAAFFAKEAEQMQRAAMRISARSARPQKQTASH